MGVYAIGITIAAVSTDAPFLEILPATGRSVLVKHVEVSQQTAVESRVGLIRSLTVGTPSSPSLPPSLLEGAAAAVAQIAQAWSAAPTKVTTPYFRRATLGAVVGNGRILWSSAQPPILVEPLKSLLLWNYSGSTSGIVEVQLTLEE